MLSETSTKYYDSLSLVYIRVTDFSTIFCNL